MKQKYINAHMECAYVYSNLSYCNRLKVGCVIVKNNRIISIGYNGTLPGTPNICESADGSKTLPTVLHAELNAITKLAQSNESGQGAAIFVTHAPCLQCAMLIISSGISEVYYTETYRCTLGIECLKEHGIHVEQVIIDKFLK